MKLAYELIQLGNTCDAMVVYSALIAAPIHRLKKTFEMVPATTKSACLTHERCTESQKKQRKNLCSSKLHSSVMLDTGDLDNSASTQLNVRRSRLTRICRHRLEAKLPQCPYLGISLADITFILEGNAMHAPTNEDTTRIHYSFYVWERLSVVINRFSTMLTPSYDVTHDEHVEHLLNTAVTDGITEDDLFNMSLELKARRT